MTSDSYTFNIFYYNVEDPGFLYFDSSVCFKGTEHKTLQFSIPSELAAQTRCLSLCRSVFLSRCLCLCFSISTSVSVNNNNNNNNNNNRIQRRYSRFFTISSQRRELPPTRTLKWPGRNRVQIRCNTSSAYPVQVSCYVPLGTKGQLSY